MPRSQTRDGIEKEWGTRRELGGEPGDEAKGDQRRITKGSDCTQKEGETKARMPAF